MQGSELLLTIGAALALVAGILAAVTTGIGWASSSEGGAESTLKAFELEFEGFGFSASVDYSEDEFDDSDGIGLLRAGGPLLIVGVVLTFLGMAALTTSLFVRGAFVTLGGAAGLALGAVFLVLANIFLPIGMDKLASETSSDLSWGAGLVLATIASAMALAGTALGFIARFSRDADLS